MATNRKHTTRHPPNRRRRRQLSLIGWMVNAVLVVVILGGTVYLLSSREAHPPSDEASNSTQTTLPDPPEPVAFVSESGVPAARLDMDALRAWCRAAHLPEPPVLESAEPAVAATLVGALRDVVRRPSAATFGRMGMISEALQSHESAIEYFRRAAEADAADFRWPYYLGCVFQVTGMSSDAVAAFEKVLALNESYPVTHARLGQLALEADRLDQAHARFQRYAELRPRDSLGHVGMGRVALRREDYQTALAHLTEAEKWGANDFQCQFNLGRVYAALGKEEQAKQHFDVCARLPKGAWFHFRDPLDQELEDSTGSVSSAVREFERWKDSEDWPRLAALGERILQQRPTDTVLLRNLALVYAKMGRSEDAGRVIDRAVTIEPQDPRLRFAQAQVGFLAKDYPAALVAADEVLRHDSEDAESHAIRARSLHMMERKDEAVAAMRRAVSINPGSMQNTYLLAEMLRGIGQTDEAAQYYRRVLELVPDYQPAADRLAELDRAGSP